MPYHSGNALVSPQLLFEKAHLQSGMHIADFGCGRTGHILFPATRIVGEKGLVYGVDILKDVLESVKKRAKISGIHTIETVWSDVERIGATAIPPKTLDVIFIVNMLAHTTNRHGVLEEARRLLKPKARLVLVDWYKKGLPFSPSDDRFVDFANIRSWGEMHGYGLQEEFDVGEYHRGMVLFKIE